MLKTLLSLRSIYKRPFSHLLFADYWLAEPPKTLLSLIQAIAGVQGDISNYRIAIVGIYYIFPFFNSTKNIL